MKREAEEQEKNKVWPTSSTPTSNVARADKVPASTVREIIWFYLQLTGPA